MTHEPLMKELDILIQESVRHKEQSTEGSDEYFYQNGMEVAYRFIKEIISGKNTGGDNVMLLLTEDQVKTIKEALGIAEQVYYDLSVQVAKVNNARGNENSLVDCQGQAFKRSCEMATLNAQISHE